jgi:hypothetical protein
MFLKLNIFTLRVKQPSSPSFSSLSYFYYIFKVQTIRTRILPVKQPSSPSFSSFSCFHSFLKIFNNEETYTPYKTAFFTFLFFNILFLFHYYFFIFNNKETYTPYKTAFFTFIFIIFRILLLFFNQFGLNHGLRDCVHLGSNLGDR